MLQTNKALQDGIKKKNKLRFIPSISLSLIRKKNHLEFLLTPDDFSAHH